jgi:hypothetical protein
MKLKGAFFEWQDVSTLNGPSCIELIRFQKAKFMQYK